jgi:Skp family chaperone for outer membrane proteins
MSKQLSQKLFQLIVFLIASTALVLHFDKTQDTGYIDLNRVYTEFEYTKSMDKEITQVRMRRQQTLDSLRYQIETLRASSNSDENRIRSLEAHYVSKRNYFQETANDLVKQGEDKVWNQINSYSVDFSKQNDISLLVGANGSGNVMYGRPEIDLTEIFIDFINLRYKGE